MIWLDLEMQILNFCGAAMTFAANWLLQSTLLISVGLLAARMFRRRGSAFQSVVYRTTLFAVLLGPMVSLAMAFGGFDGWSVKLPPAFDYSQVSSAESPAQTRASNEATLASVSELMADLHRDEDRSGFAVPRRDTRTDSEQFSSIGKVEAGSLESDSGIAVVSTDTETTSPAESDNSAGVVLTTSTTPADIWRFEIHGFGLLMVGLVITWFFVAGILAIRLAVVMRNMSRLRDRSTSASHEEIETCRRIASEMKITAPQVLRAPFLTSPFLHGVRRPAVMLPEETTLPLQDVFVHELAHLRRHDCFWLLLRQFTTIVIFFQPLLLWLGRRMDATAEEVCDDFVVQFGGNRENYANSLVDIAALSVRPMAIAGVGMVSLRSMLSRRVGRIMDTSRSLSTRVGNVLLVLVMSGGLVGTIIAGFVGLSPKSAATLATPTLVESNNEPQKDADEGNSDESAKSDEQAAPPLTPPVFVAEPTNAQQAEPAREEKTEAIPDAITGRIISHEGKPVAGAKLHWYRTRVYDIDPMMPKLLAESDNDGKFSFVPPTIPDPETEPANWDFHERIAIVAPNHGFKIVTPGALKEAKPVSVLGALANAFLDGADDAPGKLPAEGQPLRGRIVNIEGAPVAGATIRIRYHADRSRSRYNSEEEQARDSKNAEWRSWLSNLLNVIEPVSERFALPSATTNANGEFELTSLPDDCLFHLLLEGEGIQSTDIVAHNTDGEKIIVESGRQSTEPPTTVYRNNFLFVVGPSNPVLGRVTDLDTGEAVPNAVVRAFTIQGEAVYSTRERQNFATRTDKDGRYRITGLPIGDGNQLAAFTTDDVAYIPIGKTADTSKADTAKPDDAIELNFALKRCIWAKGKVIDGDTGKPFTGEMSYYWFRDRALEDAIPGLRSYNTDGLYFTNAQGEFRIPVLPTRGVLAYNWHGKAFQQPSPIDKFPRGLGAEKIEGKDEQMNAFPTMPHYLMAGNYNFMTEINPQLNDKEVEVEMVLHASKPVHLKIGAEESVDLPADGYYVQGLNERSGWQRDQTTEFVVEDLLPDETRKVFVFHREAGLAGGVFVNEKMTQPVEIKLTKSGGVKGRLVDKSGDVITDGVVSVDYDKLWSNEKYAIWMNHPKLSANPTQIPVDEEGRFELDGLIPGWKYSARVSAPRKMQGRMMSMGIGMAFVDIEINPGETRDLGDLVVGYPEKKPADDKKKETSASSSVTKPAAAENQRTFTGSVIGPDDKPIADARVSIIARPKNSASMQQMEALAEATTNSDGTFTVAVNGTFTKSHQQPRIFVRKDGFGVAGKQVDFTAPGKIAPLKLLKEEIITGRPIDIEGQPLITRRSHLNHAEPRRLALWTQMDMQS